jgi:arginyl-tRNA synthetase
MSISKARNNKTYTLDEYKIVSLNYIEDWGEVSNISVKLEEVKSEKRECVEALKYGGLYDYIQENKKEPKGEQITAIKIDGQIECFGKKNSERLQTLLNLLKISDIQRKR